MRKDIKHNFKTNPMLMDETKKIRLKKLVVIIFGSVRFLSKKVTKSKFFYFKKTEIEPKPGQTDRFWFSSVFLGQKPVQTGLALFFRFGPVLARFFFRVFLFRFGSLFFFCL